MHPLLEKYLNKRGIDITTLKSDYDPNFDEKSTFESWEATLTGADINEDTMRKFCHSQLDMIDGMWDELDNSNQKNERLVLLRIVYRKLLNLIDTSKKERERVEAEITALLHK